MRAHLSIFHLISIFPQGQALYFLYFCTPGIEGKLSTYLSTDCLNCLIAETYKLLIEMLPQDPTPTLGLFDSVLAAPSRWPELLCWCSGSVHWGCEQKAIHQEWVQSLVATHWGLSPPIPLLFLVPAIMANSIGRPGVSLWLTAVFQIQHW